MKLGYILAAVLVMAPAGARGQEHTASHLQAANELLKAMQVPEQVGLSVTLALESEFRASEQPAAFRKVIEEFFRERFTWELLADEMVALYASHFTERELRELTGFFSTPLGRKLAQVNADIMQQSWAIGTRHGELLGEELGERLMAAAVRGTVAVGTPTTGTLSDADFRLPGGQYFQAYTLQARAGDRLRITLRSSEFDALLAVAGDAIPESCGQGCSHDDDSGGDLDAMVRITIPETGTYQVLVSSATPAGTGAFTLLAELIPPGPAPELRSIAIGEARGGSITEADAELDNGTYYHLYRFEGVAGQRVTITLSSDDFDAYLFLGTMTGGVWREVASDDDGAGDSDARIDAVLDETGTYYIRATTYEPMETGYYTLEVKLAAR